MIFSIRFSRFDFQIFDLIRSFFPRPDSALSALQSLFSSLVSLLFGSEAFANPTADAVSGSVTESSFFLVNTRFSACLPAPFSRFFFSLFFKIFEKKEEDEEGKLCPLNGPIKRPETKTEAEGFDFLLPLSDDFFLRFRSVRSAMILKRKRCGIWVGCGQ